MNTLLSVSIPALTLFVAGAWNMHRSQEPTATSRTDVPSVELSASAESKTSKMWAENATLYKGETFELHFTAPNAPYLGVVDPQGHFFYVVYPRETAVGKLKPLVESKRFVSLNTLKVNTGTLKADPYTYGVYTNQPVFTQSGTYTFILGENLHVDDPDFLDKVTIQYVHSRRPSKGATHDVAMN
jgi:hypothetical protein